MKEEQTLPEMDSGGVTGLVELGHATLMLPDGWRRIVEDNDRTVETFYGPESDGILQVSTYTIEVTDKEQALAWGYEKNKNRYPFASREQIGDKPCLLFSQTNKEEGFHLFGFEFVESGFVVLLTWITSVERSSDELDLEFNRVVDIAGKMKTR